MAEFVNVLRQFDRMCKANYGCVDCPLHEPDGVSDRCSIGAFVNDSEHIEREIMSWAAEHPEPVYPRWIDWLSDVGLIINTTDQYHYAFNFAAAVDQIPADIAQKLGIEPKEQEVR